MNNLFDSLEGGSVQLQKKKKVTVYSILMTLAALVLVLATLLVSSVVLAIKNKTPSELNSDTSGSGTSPTDFLATGNLLPDATNLMILDDDHPYIGNKPVTVLLRTSRPMATETDEAVYSMYNAYQNAGTVDAVAKFNEMMTDFYAATKDTNLYVNGYDQSLDVQSPIYATAETFMLTYYSEETGRKDHSIDGVATYDWIYKNAHKYGFAPVYTAKGEEDANTSTNLFRYVGAHASYMKSSDKSLAEYVEFLRSYPASKPLSLKDSGKHSAYYIAAGEAQMIPDSEKYEYSISADNLGGLIVTYKKKS